MNRLTTFVFSLVLSLPQLAWADSGSRPQAGRPLQLHPGIPLRETPAELTRPLLSNVQPDGGAFIVDLDLTALAEVKRATGPVRIESVPLAADRVTALEVERFRITNGDTRFVLGAAGGKDTSLDFDPESVVLLRGRVASELHSRVFIAISDHGVNGFIESGTARLGISSRFRDGGKLPHHQLSIFPALVSGSNPSPFCGFEHDHEPHEELPQGPDGASPIHSLRQVQLAIETDFEFFQVFGSAPAAAAYVVSLYGATSDVFVREINTKVDLTFVRIWNTPTVPFASDLFTFRDYWNANMQNVPRDVAQMFSGRGNLPGGIAYLNALCSNFAYSFCGNVVGFFAGAQESSVYNYDLLVAAHELGHNFGTHHTDAYGLDICNQVNTPPQRGTLMSYCSQTISGGNAVMDMAFHVITQNAMKQHTYLAPCVVFDCNQNGVSDALDIGFGVSGDLNANGIPDECEDCNANGTLDPADIAFGISDDVNANGLPDECEPDCNGNGVPDSRDIQFGFSDDLHGNNIPDECEADCDGNGLSDYTQIMANMTLDKNRNVILDTCEDCDLDGLTDEVELDGAWNVWTASNGQNVVREYHAVTGVLMRTSSAGHVNGAYDLIVAPGRRVLVSSTADHRIVEFDHRGSYVRDLVAAAAGGLSSPTGLAISPAGTLLVASSLNHRVIEYNLGTGAFIRNFVAPNAGGLSQPLALAYGPDQNLYVSSATNQIYRYDGQTGALISIFVSGPANGDLNGPRGMVFKPDGHLLVTSYGNNSVREYHGMTGAFIKNWAIVGVAFQGPWCIRVAPNGRIHVSGNLVTDSHLTKADLHEFDINTGNWVRGYVQGLDAGLFSATGFDYLPGDSTDCNRNQVPDNCDIASGASVDANANGIPDECERQICFADITGDGRVNVNDLLVVINNWGGGAGSPADITNDGVVNVNDLLAVINAWGPCR